VEQEETEGATGVKRDEEMRQTEGWINRQNDK
jgi:hypothetical protein